MGHVDAVLARDEPYGAVQETAQGLSADLDVFVEEGVEVEHRAKHFVGVGELDRASEDVLDGSDAPFEFSELAVLDFEAVSDGGHGHAFHDGVGEPLDADERFVALTPEADEFASVVPTLARKLVGDLLARVGDDLRRRERVLQAIEDAQLCDGLPYRSVVRAGAPFCVVVAAVVPAIGPAAVEVHGCAADATDQKPRQEVRARLARSMFARP